MYIHLGVWYILIYFKKLILYIHVKGHSLKIKGQSLKISLTANNWGASIYNLGVTIE